jgi:hypothetical protein
MVPGFKVILFGSFGASMYMMGRLVLVSLHVAEVSIPTCLTVIRDTRPGLARTRIHVSNMISG